MVYFSNPVLNAAARVAVRVDIESVYPDESDQLMARVRGGPPNVDAKRLSDEHGVKLFMEGKDWYLAPLDWP